MDSLLRCSSDAADYFAKFRVGSKNARLSPGLFQMSILSKSFSALGKLAAVVVLLGAFLLGMTGVVYMSLSGSELKVPEIVGKDFVESEKELAALGLKIKKRA